MLRFEDKEAHFLIIDFENEPTEDVCSTFEDVDINVEINGTPFTYRMQNCGDGFNFISFILPDPPQGPGGDGRFMPLGDITTITVNFPNGQIETYTGFNVREVDPDVGPNFMEAFSTTIECQPARQMPTLSQWGIITLGLLFAIFGVNYVRRSELEMKSA